MSRYGYSGREYDRYAAANSEQSTITKMKETYWTTKQAVMEKLGKKQDEHIVASDAELDAKLELFRAIQRTTVELLRVIERYQDKLCQLSREENMMGRMLKSDSAHDKTRAGKMMAAVGKAQCYSSQQMLNLRAPLVRLYQEVETFRYRAIADTLMTVNRMEGARTEYRGALLWMKDASETLDPDTSKQLQKFRAVQQQVKKSKAKFDKLKLDTMQKIDLLAASRCNMFSHVLARYQTTLLLFWSKTSTRMTAVAQSFKGYQYFEFNLLKELGEPSKKLADETGASNVDHLFEDEDEDGEFDSKPSDKPSSTSSSKHPATTSAASDRTLANDRTSQVKNDSQKGAGSLNNLLDELDRDYPCESAEGGLRDERMVGREGGGGIPSLLDLENDDEDVDLEEIKRKQDEEFGLIGGLGQKQGKTGGAQKPQADDVDLLVDDLANIGGQQDKDDLTLLNEILNSPETAGVGGTSDSDFEHEWMSVFGKDGGLNQTGVTLSPEHSNSAEYLPSCLLDMTGGSGETEPPPGYAAALQGQMGLGGLMNPLQAQNTDQGASQKSGPASTGPQPKKKSQKPEMSAWFNLFAELDPLANPDAIGRNQDDMTDA